jgi:hypothetical protein
MEKPMLAFVLEQLGQRKGKWKKIAEEIEPEKSVTYYSWLTKLAQGKIRDPSVGRIQRLRDYFSEKSEEIQK